jgi:hypothetical protein
LVGALFLSYRARPERHAGLTLSNVFGRCPIHGGYSIRDDFRQLNYRLAKRHVLHDLAVKAVTIIIQLLPHSLKAINKMIDLMNRLT